MFFSAMGYNNTLDRVDLENEAGWGMFLLILIVLVIIFIARLVSGNKD